VRRTTRRQRAAALKACEVFTLHWSKGQRADAALAVDVMGLARIVPVLVAEVERIKGRRIFIAWCSVCGPVGADRTRAKAKQWRCGAGTARGPKHRVSVRVADVRPAESEESEVATSTVTRI